MWLVWIVFGISVVNYGYSIATGIFRGAGWSGPILFIGFTLPVALIAIVIITFINQNLLLKKHLQLSDDINESIESHHASESNTQKLSLNSGNQKYDFNLDETLFLESQGNYVCVYSLDDKEVKKTMIRITMKQVLEQAQFEQLFKCHRAYVVNLNNVEKVEGNSHGIDVKMKGFDGIIPVSRNNTKAFKEAMA
ncbi:MAG: LytTR family transcriptional regulator [Flavobacteriales bacterium]|nr:LytTR family transcriptional regulator [Flavobacteriales bacterium]